MMRRRIPPECGRQRATIHDAATMAAYSALPAAAFRPGRYDVYTYGEGGAGAPRNGGYTYPQGGGLRGGLKLSRSVWIGSKPADASIGLGGRQWGVGLPQPGVFAGVLADAGVDGARSIAVLNPVPESGRSIDIYDALGALVASKTVTGGGKGWESSAPETAGQSGAIQHKLIAGVL